MKPKSDGVGRYKWLYLCSVTNVLSKKLHHQVIVRLSGKAKCAVIRRYLFAKKRRRNFYHSKWNLYWFVTIQLSTAFFFTAGQSVTPCRNKGEIVTTTLSCMSKSIWRNPNTRHHLICCSRWQRLRLPTTLPAWLAAWLWKTFLSTATRAPWLLFEYLVNRYQQSARLQTEGAIGWGGGFRIAGLLLLWHSTCRV